VRDTKFILRKVAVAVTEANMAMEQIADMADHYAGAEIIRMYTEDCLGINSNHAMTFRSKYVACVPL
jgi:hypothetical protein